MSERTPVTTKVQRHLEPEQRAGWRATGVRLLARVGLTSELAGFALLVFVLSRLFFVVVTELALRVLHPLSFGITTFFDAWPRYDAGLYGRIAVEGYSPLVPYRAAFFPLQPLAIRLLLPLAGGNPYVTGVLVANLAFLAALLGLAALALHDADAATARRAVLFLTLFPSALFTFTGYAESLFLALAIWCVVALRHRAWWVAGLLGLLATLTRQMGLFLVLPFLWEYGTSAGWQVRRVRLDALAVLLIPTGLLIFMAWLWHVQGDPLAFIHVQASWDRAAAPPWVALVRAVPQLFQHTDGISLFRQGADFGADLLIGGLIIYGFYSIARGTRLLPLGDLLFAAAVWLVALSYPANGWPLLSNARFMLEAFPCFLLVARLTERRPRLTVAILAIFGIGLLMLTEYFVRGAPIL